MTQELSPGAIPEPVYVPTQPEEYRDNLSVRLMCHYCKEDPPNLYEDFQSGDTLCESCGFVISARGIDTRAEWRTFANDDQNTDDPSRVGDGPNPLLNGSQLQTSIAFGDSMRSKELHRAQNKATADKSNKSLLQGFKQINAYCEAYHMPLIVSDGAKHIFKDVDESKDFKGKSQEAIIAGCIFIACRRNGVPRSFQEIHHLTKVSKKEIGRTFKLLERFLMAQDRNKSKKPTMHANGKRSAVAHVLSNSCIDIVASRYRGPERDVQVDDDQHACGAVFSFLQYARARPKVYQHGCRSRGSHDEIWCFGWSVAALVCRCLHLHG